MQKGQLAITPASRARRTHIRELREAVRGRNPLRRVALVADGRYTNPGLWVLRVGPDALAREVAADLLWTRRVSSCESGSEPGELTMLL